MGCYPIGLVYEQVANANCECLLYIVVKKGEGIMSGIYDSGSLNTLFSSLGTTGNSNTSTYAGNMGIDLSDYASIKNGSYGKLIKSYYAMEDGEGAKKANSKNDTDDTDTTLANIKRTSADLKNSSADLYASKELFKKNEDGEYDMEAIYEKVSAFIEDYNSVIESTGSAETDSIAKAGANMVNATSNNIEMLAKLGISISGSDFTLSIDKEDFMEANIADIKTMFSGIGSFAYQVTAKAAMVASQAETEAAKANTYTDGATYSNNYNTGTIFNGTI